MSSLIGSLRLISTFDWSEFFESVSLVEQVLQRDPVGVYGRMDFRSRDRYRHAVEEMAEPTGEAQLRVALKSVERARQVAERTPGERSAHVGYLPDWRRPAAVRTTASAGARGCGLRLRRLFFRYATPGYLGTIALGTAVLVARRAALTPTRTAARGAMLAWLARPDARAGERADDPDPAADHQQPDSAAPPAAARSRRASRIDARTMVIVPTILDSVERARELVAHLEVQALGNLDPHISLRPARATSATPTTETLPRDAEILAAARAGIDALNAKHGDGERRPLLPVPPHAPVERAGRPVDGMGAQARQDRGVQPPAARRHRHQLRR